MAVFPGYFFGDIAYHSALLASDNVCIDLHENYIKQSQRNHTVISGPNGLVKLSIPIHKPSREDRSTGNVKIDYSENFKREHLNSIKTTYSPSPFFDAFYPIIVQFYSKKYLNLREIHLASMEIVNDIIQVKKAWKYTGEYFSAGDSINDYRIKNSFPLYAFNPYPQVFQEKQGFLPNLSIIDLIFNEGKWSRKYLIDISN